MTEKELESLFNDPLLDISPQEAALFDIPEDMQQVMNHRHQADYVAHAKPCLDFERYSPLFEQIHQDLRTGHRSLDRIVKTASLEEGRFYVVDGQLLYLEQVGKRMPSANGLPDARTRCIYENGTETDILLQTLRKNVVSNGYAVTLPAEEAESFNLHEEVKPDDICTGYIYVLRSLSTDKKIRSQKNLYKIGVTTQTLKERIARAEHEPTYLMAGVEIMDTYKIVNIHSQKLEHLIHTVLEQAKYHVTVMDDEGQEHRPSEWYVVHLEMVEEIIQRIVDGTILGYVYNAKMQCLEQVLP